VTKLEDSYIKFDSSRTKNGFDGRENDHDRGDDFEIKSEEDHDGGINRER
jgi:hypothetical protein